MKLDPFYLIVDHVDWLRRLLPCGVKLVQLRIKDASEAIISGPDSMRRKSSAPTLARN